MRGVSELYGSWKNHLNALAQRHELLLSSVADVDTHRKEFRPAVRLFQGAECSVPWFRFAAAAFPTRPNGFRHGGRRNRLHRRPFNSPTRRRVMDALVMGKCIRRPLTSSKGLSWVAGH